MKLLITGATGLVGAEITRICRVQKITVNYLTTRSEKIVSDDFTQGFLWNPAKNEIDLKCFDGVSAIINLAGASISKRWSPAYKKKVLSSRIDSLRTLHGAMKNIDTTDIKSFVSASAIGIYPDSLSKYYEEQETAVDDSFLGEVVHAWEKEIDTFNDFDLSLAKVRIGLVLSSKGGALVEMAKPIKFGLGSAFGSGQQWQSWIHVTDLALLFLFIVEKERIGVYNGVAPNPVTNSKMIQELGRVLQRPVFLPNIPRFVMKALLGEMSYLLFASQRVSSKKIEEKGFKFQYQNIAQALQVIYQKQEESHVNT